MLTIGLVELDGRAFDYVPGSGDGWKLAQLIARGGRPPERAFSDPKLDAVAFLGSSVKKLRFAQKALLHGKHVLVDFPASWTVEGARLLESVAAGRGLCVYSPNLLKFEPGFQEFKRIGTDSTSKMLSVTMTCGVSSTLKNPEFSMKLAQLYDLLEWLGNSKLKDVCAEKSAKGSRSSALVALGSFENGLKLMLNLYSAPASKRSRLWVDAVFKDSFVHVDPYAQSVRITSFQERPFRELNWATSAIVGLIEDFAAQVNGEKQTLDLAGLGRMLKLAGSVIGG